MSLWFIVGKNDLCAISEWDRSEPFPIELQMIFKENTPYQDFKLFPYITSYLPTPLNLKFLCQADILLLQSLFAGRSLIATTCHFPSSGHRQECFVFRIDISDNYDSSIMFVWVSSFLWHISFSGTIALLTVAHLKLTHLWITNIQKKSWFKWKTWASKLVWLSNAWKLHLEAKGDYFALDIILLGSWHIDNLVWF